MQDKTRKQFIEYGILGILALSLYITGLHTEVIGFLQRGILATGIMDPDIEKRTKNPVSEVLVKADLNFDIINSKGKKISLEDFKGKVIFLNLWATWCPPCIAEMPGINKLYNEVRNDSIEFVMLSQDEDFEKAKKFMERKGYDFEIYQVQDFLPPMYQKGSIPTTFVINGKSEIVLTHKGMADYDSDDFKRYLTQLK